jgi:DNA repair protein RadC
MDDRLVIDDENGRKYIGEALERIAAENTPEKRAKDVENFHQNHRARMREKFFKEGFKNFGTHEVIEFPLFFTIPRVNTNEIAHKLLHRFGSVSALFDASKEALMEAGCSESTAALFKAIPLCFRIYFGSKNDSFVYDSPRKLMSLFSHEFPVKNVEEFRLACFTPQLNLKGNVVHLINKGAPNTTEVDMRKLVYTVVHSETNSVAVSHNHPNAPAYPSTSDVAATRYIGQTLRAFGVRLLDHIIIGTDGPYSMRERGHFTIFE